MRLRVSGRQTGHEYQLRGIMDGNFARSGLPNVDILNAFVEAIIYRDPIKITLERSRIINEIQLKKNSSKKKVKSLKRKSLRKKR